jgi:hypothetical protein
MNDSSPPGRVFRISGAFKILSVISTVLIIAAGAYYVVFGAHILYRISGAALIAFGIGGFADAFVSRIVLEEDSLRVISLVRRRTYARGEFESAKVDGGQVVLMRKNGHWLKLPSTGANSLSVRNTLHAWIKTGRD